MSRLLRGLLVLSPFLIHAARAGEPTADWVELTAGGLSAWKKPTGDWVVAGQVGLKPDDPKHLVYEKGEGILVNGPTGRTVNIVTIESFSAIEAHVEFLVPKGSNAGVKFEGLYEVQIFDSFGVKTPKASDCGGIYPRAELLPNYHYLDEGYPPKVNAAKPPGEWQTLDVVFHSPCFDADNKKVANARFDKVVLNGQVVQEGVELASPTGHFWKRKELAAAPLLLQADHGPVAFRNVRVRPLGP
ncbi:MAG: DUF1080 domain-containing protein [Isosphaeraceae bacterium]|nr:DUF1080 domain-containing protein [Isosphaeraceae bacterium]